MYWPLSCWVSCESKHDTNPNYTKESIYGVVIFEPGHYYIHEKSDKI